MKRVEISSWQGTLETDKANYRALARRAGRRCLEHEGRMPVRQPYPSALSFSALRSPGWIALPGPSRAIGEIDRPLGQEMLAKAMMKFHELARRLAEEIGGRGPLVSAPRRFVHAPARAYPMLGRRGEASDGEARLSPQIKNSCKMVGAAARYTTHVFVRATRSIAFAVACSRRARAR